MFVKYSVIPCRAESGITVVHSQRVRSLRRIGEFGCDGVVACRLVTHLVNQQDAIKIVRARELQLDDAVLQPERIRCNTKALRTPIGVGLNRNMPHPQTQACNGFRAKARQRLVSWLLLGQPSVEQLLHRPGRFTEFGQPDHP